MINLGTDDEKKEVKIGLSLDSSAMKEIIDILKKYTDIFVWSYQDMSGLSIEIVSNEARMSASSVENRKSETKNTLKDQRRSQETT